MSQLYIHYNDESMSSPVIKKIKTNLTEDMATGTRSNTV